MSPTAPTNVIAAPRGRLFPKFSKIAAAEVAVPLAVLAIILALKLARVAIRLMLFLVGLVLVIGVFYIVFVR